MYFVIILLQKQDTQVFSSGCKLQFEYKNKPFEHAAIKVRS